MVEWFTEDALVPAILGGFLAICMFGFYFYSSEKVMLFIALAITAATAAIVTIERMVVTEKEKAYAMIYDAARAGNRNDDAYLIRLIKSDKENIIRDATAELERIHFDNVRVVGVKSYEASESDAPTTATISFVVFGSGRRGSISGPFNVEVTLQLEMVNDQWKVTGYNYSNPRSGLSL